MSDSESPIPPTYPLPGASHPSRRRSVMRSLRRQSRNYLTVERLREIGTTMALVIPLTLLIWVWAEREQTVESVQMQFIIDVRSIDPTKVMSIVREGMASETVTVTLSGPRAGLDEIKEKVTREPAANRLTIDISESLEPSTVPFTIALGSRLNQQKIFESNGVTVKSTTPATAEVLVDRVVDRELEIRLPAELASRVESAEILPKTLRVTGPERVINQLEASGKLVAELELNSQALMSARPGTDILLKRERIRPIVANGVSLNVAQIDGGKLRMSQEERGVIRSIAVFVAKPAGLEGQYTVTVTPLTMTNVPVVGPIDQLRKLESDESVTKPYALITVTREDIGKTLERLPTFQQLPPGVRVDSQALAPLRFTVTGADASNDSRPVP